VVGRLKLSFGGSREIAVVQSAARCFGVKCVKHPLAFLRDPSGRAGLCQRPSNQRKDATGTMQAIILRSEVEVDSKQLCHSETHKLLALGRMLLLNSRHDTSVVNKRASFL